VVPPTTANYTVSGTGVRYTYPLSWGTPTTSTELGYATRGGGAKPTGAYAYLTTFDKNKDIQIAITSSRYLPPARTPLFYDHLQWCVGTSDSKIYSSVLLFNTANGIDTPTTVVCNNGPLADATKLNATTIIQFKTKSPDGKTILGDVYTKNLTGPANLPVLRVKDAAMTNTDEIKQLLSSIKVSSDAQ
jgi:hypothetical protein